MKVRELMSTDVVSVGPGESIKEAARIMVEAGVSGIPVIDGDRLVGIITEADFVAGEAGRRTDQRASLLRFLFGRPVVGEEELTVADVMTRDVVTIGPDADHTEAARKMEKEGIKRLVVTDPMNRVLGVVSRADIMRAFIRSDEEIVAEIKDYVMKDVLWVDPDRVEVTSDDGNVVLSGKLDNRSDATLLAELTRRVDGVVSVTNHLQWDFDDTKADFSSPPPEVPRPNW
jgi:CBS domain-containing protein